MRIYLTCTIFGALIALRHESLRVGIYLGIVQHPPAVEARPVSCSVKDFLTANAPDIREELRALLEEVSVVLVIDGEDVRYACRESAVYLGERLQD